MNEDSGELFNAITQAVLASFGEVQAIYVFGSVARGVARRDSDIDIALLLAAPAAKSKPANLLLEPARDRLTKLTHRQVDLLNLRRMPTVLQKEIVMNGTRIYCADRLATEEFELLVLSLYQKLNEERAAILADFDETGRAHMQ